MANDEKIEDDELIDETSVGSFPASDPPSWTMGKAVDVDEPTSTRSGPDNDVVERPPGATPQRSKEKPRA